MSKQKIHAIVGTGTAPTEVLKEGLRDAVGSKDCVALLWQGPPNDTMEDIYDYVMDNGIMFVMFYADGVTPARVFREADNGAVQKVRDPFKAALQSVANGGSVLFLWDEDAADEQVEPVFDFVERGTLVLELTNGLAPISLDVDIPEPVEAEVAKDEDEPEDDTTFTKAELESATSFTVKRYGERMGCTAKTKSGIIAELFPELGGDEDGEEVEPSSVDSVVDAAEDDEAPSSTIILPKDHQLKFLDVPINNPEEQFEEALAKFTSALTDLARLLYSR
jgi:hypothetical protein